MGRKPALSIKSPHPPFFKEGIKLALMPVKGEENNLGFGMKTNHWT
jgi:hypothetical protein